MKGSWESLIIFNVLISDTYLSGQCLSFMSWSLCVCHYLLGFQFDLASLSAIACLFKIRLFSFLCGFIVSVFCRVAV